MVFQPGANFKVYQTNIITIAPLSNAPDSDPAAKQMSILTDGLGECENTNGMPARIAKAFVCSTMQRTAPTLHKISIVSQPEVPKGRRRLGVT